jgi:hypothetical protein
MNVFLSPVGGAAAQFFNNDGTVLSGGKIYTYAAGTSSPQTTYTTFAGNIAHTNPIILNSAGRISGGGEVWLDIAKAYKFVINTASDVLIGTYDNIIGPSALYFTIDNFTGNGSTQIFTLTAQPYDINGTFVYINGVYQNKSTYTLNGTNLTFSTAPPLTSSIEVMYVIAIRDISLNNFTGNGTTQAFTLTSAPISENSTFVFINGVYQNKNTYAVSGTTLTFSAPPPFTSIIEVMFS